MNARKVHQDRSNDQRLRFALRMTGLAVVLFSAFFLMRSITLDPAINGFFAVSGGLGFMILVAGWLPTREPVASSPKTTTLRPAARPSPVPAPVFQPVVERIRR